MYLHLHVSNINLHMLFKFTSQYCNAKKANFLMHLFFSRWIKVCPTAAKWKTKKNTRRYWIRRVPDSLLSNLVLHKFSRKLVPTSYYSNVDKFSQQFVTKQKCKQTISSHNHNIIAIFLLTSKSNNFSALLSCVVRLRLAFLDSFRFGSSSTSRVDTSHCNNETQL